MLCGKKQLTYEKSKMISIPNKITTMMKGKIEQEYDLKQNLFDPSKSSPPNEFMIKLRLRMATLGIFGILIDGVLNMLYFMFGAFGLDMQQFYLYGMPSIALVVYLVAVFGFFFSLFPPLWLQQAAGVLPPSFKDLMEKQNELKKTWRISN